jgi:tetratricopeptide (TPR) repeat protein
MLRRSAGKAGRGLWLVVAGSVMSCGAWAQTDAGSLVSGYSAAEQRAYLEAYLASKATGGGSPGGALAASAKFRASVANPPRLGSTSVLADLELRGRALYDEAELRYRIGRFDSAAKVLALVPNEYRRLNPGLVDGLQLRLALRGFGQPPRIAPGKAPAGDVQETFNQILLLVQTNRHAEALARLAEVAGAKSVDRTARDRASLWGAMIVAQRNDADAPKAALPDVPVEHPLSIDWLFAYLRTKEDAHPEAVAAIERHVAGEMPESIAKWEAREYLLRSLVRSGASNQATAQVLQFVAELGEAQEALDRQIRRVDSMNEREQAAMLASLSEGSKLAVAELIDRRRELARTAALLSSWRPHLEQTRQRLATDRRLLAEEIARATTDQAAREETSVAARFRRQLTDLVGVPLVPDAAFRLFSGLAAWEFKADYPESWRPDGQVVQPVAEDGTKRRRPQLDGSRSDRDRRLLESALEHVGKLNAKVRAGMGGASEGGFEGMLPRADDLLKRNRDAARAIEERLPELDAAIRAEIRKDLLDRKKGFQQWVNRLGYLAILAYGKSRPGVPQPYFDLEKRLAFKAGEPMAEAIRRVPVATRVRTVGDQDPAKVLEALKRNAVSAEVRATRADALRMRAGLVLSLPSLNQATAGEEAIAHYNELLASYRDLVDAAEITYQLAHALEIMEKSDASLAMLRRFIVEFPRDKRAPEVHFRLGEAQFVAGEFGAARKSYEDVLRLGSSRFRDQAEYKLAWSHFKLGEYAQAVPRFFSVIDRSGDWTTAGVSLERDRTLDAFRALSLAFHNLGGVAEIDRHFSSPAAMRPYAAEIYVNLGRYYLAHRNIGDASKTYQQLVKAFPFEPRSPALHAELIREATREKLVKVALDLKVDYAKRYAAGAPFWRQSRSEVRQGIEVDMAPILLELGQLHHADAQQQANAASWPLAIGYYGQFVESFPKNPQTPHVHFLKAEARYESGDAAGAMTDYDAAAYDYGPHKDAAEAGYAGLVATQKWIESVAGASEKAIRLRNLIGRSSRFANAFPADQRVNAVLAKAGEDLLMVGEAAEAANLGARLLARQPDEALKRRASVVVAHGLFESRRYAESEIAYRRALEVPGHTPKVTRELRDRHALAIYRQGEAYRDAGQPAMAAETFLRVAKTVPEADLVPNAEIDAAAILLSSQKWGSATAVLESFLARFPTHPLAAGIPLKLAHALENDGKFAPAADRFEALSTADNSDLSRQMLIKAADLREKAGQRGPSMQTWERYLVRFPKPAEPAAEARQLLADHHARIGDPATRDRWLAELVAEAKKTSTEATPRVRYLAGQACVVFGDARAREFDAIQLKLPLAKSLADKRAALEQSLKWYGDAGSFGVAEVSTAATFKTAELYRRLARDVMASERPGGLSELELSQYKLLLEDEASPFEEKSAGVHEINYARIKNGIYDDWVKRSMASLRTLSAARYDKVERGEGAFDYVPPPPPAPPKAPAVPGGGAKPPAAPPGDMRPAATPAGGTGNAS